VTCARAGDPVASALEPLTSAEPDPPSSAGSNRWERRAHERREAIVDLLVHHGQGTIKFLVEQLDHAHNTIRRDLEVLEEDGRIRRVVTSANLRTSYYVSVDAEGGGPSCAG
jgi:hypothetical protein